MADTVYVHRNKLPDKPTTPGNWVRCTGECCEGYGEYYTHNGWVYCSKCQSKGWIDLDACTQCHGKGEVPWAYGYTKCHECGGSGKATDQQKWREKIMQKH